MRGINNSGIVTNPLNPQNEESKDDSPESTGRRLFEVGNGIDEFSPQNSPRNNGDSLKITWVESYEYATSSLDMNQSRKSRTENFIELGKSFILNNHGAKSPDVIDFLNKNAQNANATDVGLFIKAINVFDVNIAKMFADFLKSYKPNADAYYAANFLKVCNSHASAAYLAKFLRFYKPDANAYYAGIFLKTFGDPLTINFSIEFLKCFMHNTELNNENGIYIVRFMKAVRPAIDESRVIKFLKAMFDPSERLPVDGLSERR